LSYWLVKNHAEETDPNPILNKLELLPSTKLFKIRNFLTVSIFTSACMFCLASVSFISSFYLQDVLKLTATQAGLYLIPIPIGMAVFSVISGFFRNWRLGSIFGGSIITIGLFILSTVTPDQAYFNGLFWGYLLVSAGAGFMFTNTFAAGLGSISKHLSGLGSGYLNTLQQLGAFAGVAFVASFNLLSNYQSLYLALVGVGIVAIISAFFITNQQHEY
jgi:predicted MFS family arabinose efflux permease